LTALGMVKKKFYYGTNIKVLLKKSAGKNVRRNPFLRPALFRNANYLFKSPIKYLAIFVMRFFETLGIVAGMLSSSLKKSKYSEKELSKLMVDIFYGRKKTVELNRKDLVRFLKLCSGNRVLYQVARALQRKDLEVIIETAEERIRKTQKTLDFIKENLP